MNSIGHIFFAQILLLILNRQYATPAALIATGIASILIDLEHIPKMGHAIRTGRFGPSSRTRWHEMRGLFAFMSASLGVTFLSEPIGRSLLIGFVSHYFLDFLTRPTRPLFPREKEAIFLKLAPQSLRGLVIYDTILTTVMGVIWVWSLQGMRLL